MSRPSPPPFSGSYDPRDVVFLLTPMKLTTIPVAQKEKLIQSGAMHYSETLSPESMPSPAYTRLFLAFTERHGRRLAQEVLSLAAHLAEKAQETPLVLLSLARAGTPIGALILRALRQLQRRQDHHYSLSIIRDRGLDETALRWICARHAAQGICFVDGWTAKGVIAQELRKGIKAWNRRETTQLPDRLAVISDIGGVANLAATNEDYPIPCGIMNGTVSGLVSRTVLNQQIKPGQYHGTAILDHLAPADRSTWFLDQISRHFPTLVPQRILTDPQARRQRQQQAQDFIQEVMVRHGIQNVNHIKPSIAEATRVLLRRVPGHLILRNPTDPDVAHLLLLAEEKGVPISNLPDMPYRACALIAKMEQNTLGTQWPTPG